MVEEDAMAENHELSVTRLIDAPVEAVWKAFAEHLEEWWCPRPWTTELLALELRAGGRLATIMRGPNGEGGEPMEGVVLEAVPARRVVWTNALDTKWQPQVSPVANLIGSFEFEPEGNKTRYRASARHWDEASAEKHDKMGFSDGWGIVAEQLEAVAKRVAETADA
jgi:uncharacterized protein YndB with AHSA1/START domain